MNKPLVSPLISFKTFKEVSLVSKYGNNGAYHVYYGYSNSRYTYRIKLHNANQENALRAAYYLLFIAGESEQGYVEQGKFKISIVCGNQANSFYAGDFNARYLRDKIKWSKEI